MFLVYIDDFMSSNPSWHQPNPRYQQQQGVPPHLYGTNNKDAATPMAPPPSRYQQQQQQQQQQQHGVPPPSFLWYQQQKQGAPPPMPEFEAAPSYFMVPTPGYPPSR